MWQRVLLGALVLRSLAHDWFKADVDAWSSIPPTSRPKISSLPILQNADRQSITALLFMSKGGVNAGDDAELDDDERTKNRPLIPSFMRLSGIKGKFKGTSPPYLESENKSNDRGILNKVFGNSKTTENRSKETQKSQNSSNGFGISGFVNKLFDKDDKKDARKYAKKDKKKENKQRSKDTVESINGENGFFQSVASRLPWRKEEEKSETRQKAAEPLKSKSAAKELSVKKEATYFAPTKSNGEGAVSFERTVLNSRKNLDDSEIGGDFFLESPGDFLLTLEEQEAKRKEAREQREAKLRKEKEERASRMRQAELQARTDYERRRESQMKALRKKEGLADTKVRKDQTDTERQRRVSEACNEARSEISDTTSSVALKSTDLSANEKRKFMNPQAMFQNLFSKAEQENATAASESSSFSFPNPLSAIPNALVAMGASQRLVSNVWNARFGGEKQEEGEEWVVVFPKTRLDPGEVVPVNIKGIDLLVAASVDGKKLYSIANSCPHLGTPLETGPMIRRPVEGKTNTEDCFEDCIVCPLHRTTFSMETGAVRGEWCPYPPVLGAVMGAVKQQSPVAVFDVRTRGKNVEVRINSSLDQMANVERKSTTNVG